MSETTDQPTTSTDESPQTFGTPYEGGYYGGNIKIAAATFAIAWAPKESGEIKGMWLDRRLDVPGAVSCCDSMANTRAMAEAGSVAAQQALAASIGGFTDWCLPARDVLEPAYRYLKPTTYGTICSFRDGDNPSSVPVGYPYSATNAIEQTSVADFQAGGPQAFDEAWYGTSTQYSESYVWGPGFDDGHQSIVSKSYERRFRFVRLIQLSA